MDCHDTVSPSLTRLSQSFRLANQSVASLLASSSGSCLIIRCLFISGPGVRGFASRFAGARQPNPRRSSCWPGSGAPPGTRLPNSCLAKPIRSFSVSTARSIVSRAYPSMRGRSTNGSGSEPLRQGLAATAPLHFLLHYLATNGAKRWATLTR